MTITPITPKEVATTKWQQLPETVVECWNQLIAKNFSAGSSVVKQDDAISALLKATGITTRALVYTEGWLDIEEMYVAFGWEVDYDKPGYSETYPATFTFTPK
jgi:uncharacterized iron-regulated protein